jgi:hypothetical protein
VVSEDQRGAVVDVQERKFGGEVVVEKRPGRGDAGVVDQQADLQAVRGPFDKGHKVIARKVGRNNPRDDGMLPVEVVG